MNDYKNELILNPNIEAVKPKVKNLVNIQKQLERPETPKQKEKELALEKNYKHIDKKVKG